MKKNILTLSILSVVTIPVLATDFVVKISDINNDYVVGGFTDVSTGSGWVEKSNDCTVDITEEDIYYNESATQTQTCTLIEEQTVTVERTYENGTVELIKTYQEEKINDPVITTTTITGTFLVNSCKELLSFDNTKTSGNHTLKFSDGTMYSTYCDMDTAGGGWTRLDNSILTNSNYSITYDIKTGIKAFANGLLALGDATAEGGNNITVSIELPFDYSQFYLNDYTVKGNNITGHSYDFSLDLTPYDWSVQPPMWVTGSTTCGCGDLAFGSLDETKPTTSFYNQGAVANLVSESLSFPSNNTIFNLSNDSNNFSIRSVESGSQDENLFVWYSGYVFVR